MSGAHPRVASASQAGLTAAPPLAATADAPILRIRGLGVEFAGEHGAAPALRGVDLDVAAGRCVGVVGESGSGKSVTSLAVMGLLPQPGARITSGSIEFEGRDLLAMSAARRRMQRGRAIAMIFQDPLSSLNPVFTIGDQIAEAIVAHEAVDRRAARRRAIELLDQVRIPSAARRVDDYPHRLSGGMRQRVMIAMALACNPRLLIADEPTTALDVTVQAQIVELLDEIRRERGTAIVLISHNLGLVAGLADEIAVMYAGRIVEHGPAERVISHPEHPYTVGLLGAVPRAEPGDAPLIAIPGSVPDLRMLPAGCAFAPRCPFRLDACQSIEPALNPLAAGHAAACHAAPLEPNA
ncbi:ABC transporter ATP-binding protein [Paraburkholderia caballeronis]|uniref:ABC transporter ATP-binding protein n=1 Tax=Paraburkholderia caballeronis TaxID=416943 RepID=UPI0010650565|nr:ABC transporter ATP-binding protein [Paraburkholderia caballeronis]TDV05498.1 peptide/nickel transport system ATP-binding protein [Paraburkholderia caballeronis]TDV09125.1 peptide/nickel transport system ATP-binding protein [Paraburkholderia caballeronis]TDV20245.1 peptide/nickel transport system ATP-binding protein [Paraburkholderia caballeronis]